jgi:hypothetical protein
MSTPLATNVTLSSLTLTFPSSRALLPELNLGTTNAPDLKITRISDDESPGAILIQHPARRHTFRTVPSVTNSSCVNAFGFEMTLPRGMTLPPEGIGAPRWITSVANTDDATSSVATNAARDNNNRMTERVGSVRGDVGVVASVVRFGIVSPPSRVGSIYLICAAMIRSGIGRSVDPGDFMTPILEMFR